jgi:hypothetical protein
MEPGEVQKKGTITKCPSCGAQVAAFASSCGSCGHEFADIDANRTITMLVNRFDEIEREVEQKGLGGSRRLKEILEKKARVIRDFPIPNAREDLQQLMYFIQPKIVESVKPDPNIEDWRAKFSEVLIRAKKAYQNDSSALEEFQRIEASLTSSIADKLKIKIKRNPLFVLLLLGVATLSLFGFVGSQISQYKIRQCEKKYEQGSNAEQKRLESLFSSVETQLRNKKYAEAMASVSKIRWEYQNPGCKVSENQQSVATWGEKRFELSALIQNGMDIEAAEKTAEAERQLAEKNAEANRQLAEKQAEAKKVAELAHIQAGKARAKAAAVQKAETDKKW